MRQPYMLHWNTLKVSVPKPELFFWENYRLLYNRAISPAARTALWKQDSIHCMCSSFLCSMFSCILLTTIFVFNYFQNPPFVFQYGVCIFDPYVALVSSIFPCHVHGGLAFFNFSSCCVFCRRFLKRCIALFVKNHMFGTILFRCHCYISRGDTFKMIYGVVFMFVFAVVFADGCVFSDFAHLYSLK